MMWDERRAEGKKGGRCGKFEKLDSVSFRIYIFTNILRRVVLSGAAASRAPRFLELMLHHLRGLGVQW